MDRINGIELYTIHKEAFNTYKKEVRQGANATIETIQRKLTALVINATEKRKIFKNKFMCRFGGFVMVVNEDTKMIEVLYWDNEKTHKSRVPKEVVAKLTETYKILGLSSSGNNVIMA